MDPIENMPKEWCERWEPENYQHTRKFDDFLKDEKGMRKFCPCGCFRWCITGCRISFPPGRQHAREAQTPLDIYRPRHEKANCSGAREEEETQSWLVRRRLSPSDPGTLHETGPESPTGCCDTKLEPSLVVGPKFIPSAGKVTWGQKMNTETSPKQGE